MNPTDFDIFLQQLLTGLANGLIVALIALGYSLIFGVLEFINFAHGDIFMLGCFAALTFLGVTGLSGVEPGSLSSWLTIAALLVVSPLFSAGLNFCIEKIAYRPLRNAPKLTPLVSALGVSFILMNIGLFWGGLPLEVFGFGRTPAAPKDFPALLSAENVLGDSVIYLTARDVIVLAVVVPTLVLLRFVVMKTTFGKCMRAVAQDRVAASLMGIDTDKIISRTFILAGALAGLASVIVALTYNTISFQMGFRYGLDAFTAAVVGGIGSLVGACFGGVVIGVLRAMSDQYISTQWTNAVVFSALILILIFKPSGLLGARGREKV